jgi:L-lysine 6-transaminase
MPPVLTESARTSARSQTTSSKPNTQNGQRNANDALESLERHILMDGFRIVFDLERSRGSYIHDASTGDRLIDFYGFFGSVPVGFNHPHFSKPEVEQELLCAAKTKIANSDVYSEAYADFVETFTRVAPLPPLNRYLFIEGGALAIENCLKAAMDWKVRKNMAAGRGERGTEILHFRHAFHGRSGYTMSLTNTDPKKTDLFAKFNWPRISTPYINFALEGSDAKRTSSRARSSRAGDHAVHLRARDRYRGDHHRADPGRRRRQSFPRRMAADAPPHLRRERDAPHFRRSAVRDGNHRAATGRASIST